MNGTPVITCPKCQAQRTGGGHTCLSDLAAQVTPKGGRKS